MPTRFTICYADGRTTTAELAPALDIPDNSLKALFVPREKCSVMMKLTPRQWCAVLSGLKDAKTLKELDVDMSEVRL